MKATIRDLRNQTKALLDTVDRGEEVILTRNGKVCAKIIPLKNKTKPFHDIGFGMWADRKEMKNTYQYLKTLRKGRFTRDC